MDYRWTCDESPSFADKDEAEDWLRDTWAELLADGVDEVTLMRGDEVVYGPMSLHSPD